MRTGLLAVLGLALVGVAIGVGKVTRDQYVPFAFAVFASTIAFAGAVNYAIAAQENFVQPAAVLRSADGQGIRGLYIADDDEYISIGVIRNGYVPPEADETVDDTIPMYRIPRTDETRLLIGKAQGFNDAVGETEALPRQLRETVQLAPTEEGASRTGS